MRGGLPASFPVSDKMLGIAAVVIAVAASITATHAHLYKTWGNNEHYYVTSERLVTFCDMALFRQPQNCVSVDVGTWCEGEGGAWNAGARECAGVSGQSCREVLGALYSDRTCQVPIRHVIRD